MQFYLNKITAICCIDTGDIDNEIEEEKKKHQDLDAQIREMEKKLREKQLRNDGKRAASGSSAAGGGGSSAGKRGSNAKSASQRNARRLEDQLQLVKCLAVI